MVSTEAMSCWSDNKLQMEAVSSPYLSVCVSVHVSVYVCVSMAVVFMCLHFCF